MFRENRRVMQFLNLKARVPPFVVLALTSGVSTRGGGSVVGMPSNKGLFRFLLTKCYTSLILEKHKFETFVCLLAL